MRESIKELVNIFSRTYPIEEPIFEFGSYQVPEQKDLANLRPIFPDKKYVGCDIRKGPGVDLILDLHDINLDSRSVGTLLILDTLEHVEYPQKAMSEAYRILKPGGTILISSVMNFPIHEHPSDYWRFTPEGFKSLLNDFKYKYVDFAGDEIFPHTVLGIASKTSNYDIQFKNFKEELIPWKKKWDKLGENPNLSTELFLLIKSGLKNPNKIPSFISNKILK